MSRAKTPIPGLTPAIVLLEAPVCCPSYPVMVRAPTTAGLTTCVVTHLTISLTFDRFHDKSPNFPHGNVSS
ncbi:hypothetical protein J6590_035785 [Homalodisca vitripennis]|nr:hypothetical protein J6590_035785 [Homalodisca vitripennis]